MAYIIGTPITNGVVLSDSTTQNPATITSTGYVGDTETSHGGDAIYGETGTAWKLFNDGTIVANTTLSTSNGIHLKSGGTVTNRSTGSIAAKYAGIKIDDAAGTVANLGNVSGDYSGISLLNGKVTNGQSGASAAVIFGGVFGVRIGTAGTVANFSTITGASGVGVFLQAGGSVANRASGAGATLISGYTGVKISGTFGAVANFATIVGTGTAGAGVHLDAGGNVTNGASGAIAASISGNLYGVRVQGSTGTVANFATVAATGTYGVGVGLVAGGTVINGTGGASTALISGALWGIAIGAGAGTIANFGIISGNLLGIVLQSGGSITVNRDALVFGGMVGISIVGGAGTVTNSGHIGGGGGTAIQFGDYNDSLILNPGAAFLGKVDGGAGSNTLELRADTTSGTLSGLGSSFVNFGQVLVDPGAEWTVEVAAPTGGQLVTASGGGSRLIFDAAGTIDLSGVKGFSTIVLSDFGSNTASLENINFIGLSSTLITVKGGGFGNAVDASGVTGSNRVALTGGIRADTLIGGAGNDALNADAGNDTLDGNSGVDTMIGGFGSDTYVVDNAGDVVGEAALAGVDMVRTTLTTYTLDANIENLTFVGAGTFSGTGNGVANIISGGPGSDTLLGGGSNDTLNGGGGNDTLNGNLGADTMAGGLGNDTYFVDNPGDVVSEAVSAGIDAVRTTQAAYTLGANLENLVFIGSGNFAGTGNGLANIISGGSGNDTLTGGGGNDTLAGGAGNDQLHGDAGHDSFLFNTPLNATTNIDHVFDFSSVDDKILLSHSVFTAAGVLGTLAPGAFFIGAGAHDTSDRIIYHSFTGALGYDPDGNGSTPETQFATLSAGLALTNGNFAVV